jgi:acyl-CoA synthetase (AMP-forming)/AMP-acid ligase II
MTSLADLLASVFDRRKVWPAPAKPSERSIAELAFELVSSAGEASGLASAAAIMASYSSLDDASKPAFFRMLSVEMNISADKVRQALDLYEATPSRVTYRDFAAAAEPPRQELIRRLSRVPRATGSLVRTGHHILERYGMTETNMNTSNPYDGERRASTVGLPLSRVEVKVTDPETGATLPENTVGQNEVRGPNAFKGYWQMPEKTLAELRGNGFFITGDLSKIDEDGYVHILGRNKDLIISGEYNIYPKEIDLLDAQPGVPESAVISVPHRDMGETVIGLIVAEPGQSPDLEQIMEAIQATLARFKQPRRLIVVPELLRNAMAKVQKNILWEQFKNVAHAVRRGSQINEVRGVHRKLSFARPR